MSSVIVVDGLPQIDGSKYDKLLGFVSKIFTAYGELVPEGIYMPLNKATGATEG